jgi:excisionase family DNA binding protein
MATPLTATEAAKALGVSHSRIMQFIRTKRLPARKFGAQWVIERKDLAAVRVRKPGRPKKPK